MKKLFFAALALVSLSAVAQVVGGGNGGTPGPVIVGPGPQVISGGAQVVITPVWPTTCFVSQFKRHLNTVYNVQKMDESDETVTFRFNTQYVRCNDGRLEPYRLEGYGAVAEVVSKKFILVHRNGKPMETRSELSRPDELEVTVKFYKKRIFRSDKQTGKEFQMVFLPVNHINGYRFWWNVWLIRDVASGSYDMKISQANPQ